jgi:hypothetical protein
LIVIIPIIVMIMIPVNGDQIFSSAAPCDEQSYTIDCSEIPSFYPFRMSLLRCASLATDMYKARTTKQRKDEPALLIFQHTHSGSSTPIFTREFELR